MIILKSISLLICVVACVTTCLLAGCLDQNDSSQAEESETSELAVTITSPSPGHVISGDEMIRFESQVSGGQKPYTYLWTSPLDGILSTKDSFDISSSDLKKGRHIVVLKVTDETGDESSASVTITVL